MEIALSDLANKNDSRNRVQDSMNRFQNQRDINDDIYCYDEINVYSNVGFSSIINTL